MIMDWKLKRVSKKVMSSFRANIQVHCNVPVVLLVAWGFPPSHSIRDQGLGVGFSDGAGDSRCV